MKLLKVEPETMAEDNAQGSTSAMVALRVEFCDGNVEYPSSEVPTHVDLADTLLCLSKPSIKDRAHRSRRKRASIASDSRRKVPALARRPIVDAVQVSDDEDDIDERVLPGQLMPALPPINLALLDHKDYESNRKRKIHVIADPSVRFCPLPPAPRLPNVAAGVAILPTR